jgi:hypothetical protein
MVIGCVFVGSSKNFLFSVVNVRTGDDSGIVTEGVIFFVLFFLFLVPFFGVLLFFDAILLICYCLINLCDTA